MAKSERTLINVSKQRSAVVLAVMAMLVATGCGRSEQAERLKTASASDQTDISVVNGHSHSAGETAHPATGSPKHPEPSASEMALSTEERTKLYQDDAARFSARFRAWMEEYSRSKKDPFTLERAATNASYTEPTSDMSASVKRAGRIVVGSVKEVKFFAGEGQFASPTTQVVLMIDETLKGSAASEISIVQSGGPFPGPDFAEAEYLVFAENEHVFRPSDTFVLLLEKGKMTPEYVQSFTGSYQIVDGRVSALPGNPFRAEIDGKTVKEFTEKVQKEVERQK